ncbi:hypothetical protein F4802DRAFT_430296 [Xylaria palmicola]|nr:hypothetical protein F4802DRAFT_430296 [Xylaria palmicola]
MSSSVQFCPVLSVFALWQGTTFVRAVDQPPSYLRTIPHALGQAIYYYAQTYLPTTKVIGRGNSRREAMMCVRSVHRMDSSYSRLYDGRGSGFMGPTRLRLRLGSF